MKTLNDSEFVIVGTGLMGASLALALRGKVKSLHGIDINPQHLRDAARCFDRLSGEITAETLNADVVVLATPVRTILVLLDRIAKLVKPGTLIMDMGSTKRDIVVAMNELPDGMLAVGAHPMCGRETSGPVDANAEMFIGRPYIFCRTRHTTDEAAAFAQEMATSINAVFYLLDAAQHDAATAAISHLPYLVSSGLVGMVQQLSKRDGLGELAWQLASTGFRDTSRLAGSDVAMMADIVETNREAVFHALDVFHEQIDSWKQMLTTNRDLQLRDSLEKIRHGRRNWEQRYFKPRQTPGIDGQTQLVGVMGWPVKHSLSPAMHNAAFDKLGLNWRYLPLAVEPSKLADAMRGLPALGWRGVNLTVPHKVDVLPLLAEISDEARLIGAANTVRIEAEMGALCGTNTDRYGFMADLAAHDVTVDGSTHAVLLGAGGAARAISIGLLKQGAQLSIVNRTMERAEELVRLLKAAMPEAQVNAITAEALGDVSRDVSLIVNATSVGMWPNVDASSWPSEVPFPRRAVLYDTIYRPQTTKLMREAAAAGLRTIGGIGMLVHQGAAAFTFWTGVEAPVAVMLQACLAKLAEG
jgi:shikimate dehydrogenase